MSGRGRWVRGRASSALLLTALVVLITLVGAGSAIAGPPWSDAPNYWWVVSYGVTDTEAATVADGQLDGKFYPWLDVTRAQFAKMAVEGTGSSTASPPYPTFTDVPPTHYFYPWIEGGVVAGFITGQPNGTYGPDNNIIRQQANSMLGSYLAQKELNLRGHVAGELANYVSLNTWYVNEGVAILMGFADYDKVATVHAPATAYLIYHGVVEGSSSGGALYLKPGANLTRAQAVALILRVRAVTFATALPTVTALNPAFGPTAGGNSVVITGTNFTDVTSVKFGTKAATSYVVNSATQITAVAPAGTLGAIVDVAVTTPAGTSAASAASKYSYGIPTVTSVAPASGPVGGGNSVVITGTNFVGVTAVKFGTKSAMSYSVNSATQITAVAPSGTSGTTVDVTVTTAAGTTATSAASKYSYGPPTVTGLSPASGPAIGGNTVTITGTGFTGVTAVKFGTKAATSFTVVSATQITAVAPSGTAGTTVDVTVTTGGGTSAIGIASLYSYGGPTITSLSPPSGPTSGGTTVVINGSGFTGVTAVTFGTKSAISYVVNSITKITAVAPSGHGVVDVRVTTAAGTSAIVVADEYTYGAAITSVVPNHGPAAGSNLVEINGGGFTGATSVTFGAVTILPADFTVNPSGTKITLHAPPGTGKVDIRVNIGAITSANTAADDYRYAPTISSLSANRGAFAGGNTVTITGTGFTGATGVTFGGVPGTSFYVVSDTQITVKAPAHAPPPATVQVRVIGAQDISADAGLADDYSYGGPEVSSLVPNHGPAAGGTLITVYGTGFTGASDVLIGATHYAVFTVNAAGTAIYGPGLSTPPGTSVVDVRVTVAAVMSANTAADNFTYAPTITAALNPNTGPTAGGTTVTITGTGFTGATGVTFGGTPGTDLNVVNDTSLTVKSPPHATAETVQVRVVGVHDTSANAAALDDFTYVSGPVVTLVQPNVGPNGVATPVTITGLNFQTSGATKVTFGGVDGTAFIVVSDTQITVTTPAGEGLVDVIVKSPIGDSPVSPDAKYQFSPKVTSTNPIFGPTYGGGGNVTITGSGFTGATSVEFDGGVLNPGDYTVNSDTQITVTDLPSHAAGFVTVSVTTGAGTGTSGAIFEYRAPAATYVDQAAYKPEGGSWTAVSPTTLVNGTHVDLKVRVLDQWHNPLALNTDVSSSHPWYRWHGLSLGTSDGGRAPISNLTDVNGFLYWTGEGGCTDQRYTLQLGLDLNSNGDFVGEPCCPAFDITWGTPSY